MPDELMVVTATQTLRADAAVAYLAECAAARPVIIFTGDPGAFGDKDLPPGVRVEPSTDRPALLDRRRVSSAGRRRLIAWMRSGSSLGRSAERLARRLLGRLRPASPSPEHPPDHPLNRYLIAELQRLHWENPITEVVVFDVFDLPAVLDFAAGTENVRVKVR